MITMTMTLADRSVDDGVVGPRVDRPKRRRFSAEYKLRVLAEYDAAEPGERGALLRREGLYSSHVVDWRRARDAGALDGLSAQPRTGQRSVQQSENEQLRRDNERLQRELTKTRAALDVVGNLGVVGRLGSREKGVGRLRLVRGWI